MTPTPEAVTRRSRRLVVGARMALLMILIASVVLFGIGIVALLLADPPEVDGWLRSLFGAVFGRMALAIAALLGIPSAIGVWAMAGATAPDAIPALGPTLGRVLVALAAVVVATMALIVVVGGRGATLLDLGFTGLAASLILGLCGAAVLSPHRLRAAISAAGMMLVMAGSIWFVAQALPPFG
jgi:hypothetical protein